MGAHVILINPRLKKAVSTTIPLKSIENYTGPLANAPTLIEKQLELFYPEYKEMYYFDTLVESDAHGQLHADDVVFDDTEFEGYYFNDRSWAW